MNERKRIIIYNNKVYALSESQLQELLNVFQAAENLPSDIPLAEPVHVQAHIHSASSSYEYLGNLDKNVDEELSSLFKKSFENL